MGTVITIVILVVVGFFIWIKFVKPQLSGQLGSVAIEAQKDFDEQEAEIKKEAFENPLKFGAFKTIIPETEKITAIASYLEPKGIGKNLLGEAKTFITNVRKVNMCLFYLIMTDQNLHAVAYNGDNTVSHDIFDLREIKDVRIEKTGSAKNALKSALAGVEGDYHKMIFTYKGEKYEYNLMKLVHGFPIFDVNKDTVNETFYRSYRVYDKEAGNAVEDYRKKEFYADNLLRVSLYSDFQKAISGKYHVQFPAN